MERSEGWWSDKVERHTDARKVACRKLRGARKRGGRYTESTLEQLQKSNGGEEEDQEEEEGIVKENNED